MRDIVITECLHGNVVYDLQPNIGSSTGVELGTATYKEEDYLAIRFEGTSVFSIYFTGVYSGDCTFELMDKIMKYNIIMTILEGGIEL